MTAVDQTHNESAASDTISARPLDTGIGIILREYWTGISGTSISALTSSVNYPDNPTGRQMLQSLEGPIGFADNYGTRIRGFLHPPADGFYTFWIAGDDNCQLWLSTDGSPANAALIASVPGWTNSRQWDKYTQQQSAPIPLSAGRKYYLEVLHKEGTGGDHVAVSWTGPGLSQQIIDGAYLSRWFVGRYGDFTGDGRIDLDDAAVLVSRWLLDDCIATAASDLNGDCTIDLFEWSRFAAAWLDESL